MDCPQRDFFMRLICGLFKKFGLISEKKKRLDSYLVQVIKFRLIYDISPKKNNNE